MEIRLAKNGISNRFHENWAKIQCFSESVAFFGVLYRPQKQFLKIPKKVIPTSLIFTRNRPNPNLTPPVTNPVCWQNRHRSGRNFQNPKKSVPSTSLGPRHMVLTYFSLVLDLRSQRSVHSKKTP
jgi:hypothetical protein